MQPGDVKRIHTLTQILKARRANSTPWRPPSFCAVPSVVHDNMSIDVEDFSRLGETRVFAGPVLKKTSDVKRVSASVLDALL